MTISESLLDHRIGLPAEPWQGPVPAPDIDSQAFWDGLRGHRLLIMRCDDCEYWVHPPLAGCPRCLSPRISPQEVSGRGKLYSYTVVNREFAPGIKPPYIAAFVDLAEQAALRLLTNLVNVRIRDIRMDMPVRVVFHDIGEATLAFFEPMREQR